MGGAPLEGVVRRLLEHQDPTRKHTWVTRITISSIIVTANGILYGFYGLIGSVGLYLLGVELAGLALEWLYVPLVVMLAYGLWKSYGALIEYWRHHGHG